MLKIGTKVIIISTNQNGYISGYSLICSPKYKCFKSKLFYSVELEYGFYNVDNSMFINNVNVEMDNLFKID